MSPELDPDAGALLEAMLAAGTAQPYAMPLGDARERMRTALAVRGEPIPLSSVEEISLPSPHGPLALRIYRPGHGRLPAALFMHGGGWALNDLDTHDRLCRLIARRSGSLIASLDYRRAPEHRHPAPLEDAHLAYRWLLDNASSIGAEDSRLALVGESAGATTASALALLLRDLGGPAPSLQALAYPIVSLSEDWPSFEQRGSGYTLDREFVRWAWRHYLPDGHSPASVESLPYLVPLPDVDLAGLPPTFLITAEFDPLRDQGFEYAQRLIAAGVEVEHVHAHDQMHGFMLLDRAVARVGPLVDRLGAALAAAGAGGRA
ncbi:MAG: alpha/beta hydrolase [Solirubrobacteraceae bacterium]